MLPKEPDEVSILRHDQNVGIASPPEDRRVFRLTKPEVSHGYRVDGE